MDTKTITSRQFNQDTARAKRAAQDGPVFITDRGQPAHVLLSIAAYRSLTDRAPNLVELLGMAEGADIEFEPGRVGDIIARPFDFD